MGFFGPPTAMTAPEMVGGSQGRAENKINRQEGSRGGEAGGAGDPKRWLRLVRVGKICQPRMSCQRAFPLRAHANMHGSERDARLDSE